MYKRLGETESTSWNLYGGRFPWAVNHLLGVDGSLQTYSQRGRSELSTCSFLPVPSPLCSHRTLGFNSTKPGPVKSPGGFLYISLKGSKTEEEISLQEVKLTWETKSLGSMGVSLLKALMEVGQRQQQWGLATCRAEGRWAAYLQEDAPLSVGRAGLALHLP